MEYPVRSVNDTTLTLNLTMANTTFDVDINQLLLRYLGPPRREPEMLVLLTIIYSIIFVSGTVGNICTCIVIARTASMHTTTNFYLFSLAISDLLLLCFGLPTELYTIWEAYPWRLGVVFCYLRQTCMEVTSYASVLTITAFTVERYVAICRPLLAYKMATLSRATKIIIAIWIIALLTSLPYSIHTRTYYKVTIPDTNTPVPESYVCSIPEQYLNGFMYYMFQISTFIFFITPITIIIILYVLIGLALRKSQNGFEDKRRSGSSTNTKSTSAATLSGNQPRKVVIRMLVAVTIAFIICWAPFHGQRLMILYISDWTPALHTVQTHIFDVSGVLYFVSSTVNPILYSLISNRYRMAFKKTILPCLPPRQSTSRAMSNVRGQGYSTVSSIRSPITNHHYNNNHNNHHHNHHQQQLQQNLHRFHPTEEPQNGCVTGPASGSQAMVVMKKDSTSLKLIFRKDHRKSMRSYETIPLTPSVRVPVEKRTFDN